jgi:hypothetical protein
MNMEKQWNWFEKSNKKEAIKNELQPLILEMISDDVECLIISPQVGCILQECDNVMITPLNDRISYKCEEFIAEHWYNFYKNDKPIKVYINKNKEDIVDWHSTNLLDEIKEERKELLIRWFNLTHKEIKNITCKNERFKALIYPILATIYKEIHIDWHSDIKTIIDEVKNECVGVSNDIDSEMKFVRTYSKNKIEEIKERMANSMK